MIKPPEMDFVEFKDHRVEKLVSGSIGLSSTPLLVCKVRILVNLSRVVKGDHVMFIILKRSQNFSDACCVDEIVKCYTA